MRILTWNCNGALRKKFRHLDAFQADIIVVQECENPAAIKDTEYREWAKKFLWVGENSNKGLGIFARDNVKIDLLDWDTMINYGRSDNRNLKYFIACTINNEFTLLGAWCHGANSPTFGYVGQLWQYLQKHKTKLKKTIIAGDFNSNVTWDRWDRWWNHSDVVRELGELNIENVYLHYFKEEAGKESRPTFYLHRNREKPYHIDYIFASSEFIDL